MQSASKNFQTALSSTQLVSPKFTERLDHRAQLKFLTQPVPKTVVQFHRIDNFEKPEPITSPMLGLLDFFSKKATFKLSLMANDENKFLPIFQILDIKNVSFLLKLEMADATTIRMKFEPVCVYSTGTKTKTRTKTFLYYSF